MMRAAPSRLLTPKWVSLAAVITVRALYDLVSEALASDVPVLWQAAQASLYAFTDTMAD